MLESINIGMSGLLGYSKGLRVIANNTANLNTPGFKSSSIQFAHMFASSNAAGGGGLMQVGYGLNTTGTALNFKQGELRQTGNSLDLAVDGQGLFTLKDEAGLLHYTRAGQFQFDSNGVLVNRSDGRKVMGRGSDGAAREISIAQARTKQGSATTTVKFSGNLSSDQGSFTVNGVKVLDSAGGEHDLSARLTNTDATLTGSWTVDLMQGTTVIGTGQIIFTGSQPQLANSKVTVTYSPAGVPPLDVTLDFSTNVTSVAAGQISTLAFASQDGIPTGELMDATFDATGTLVMRYSNGQASKGVQLMLGRFDSLDTVAPAGSNQFDATDALAWHTGVAGEGAFGAVKSGSVEISNVDLANEFADLVIMQRGYQAASQIITTANEMLQQLFAMRGK
jgi:flagellar hook protein FlgE